MAWTEKLPNGRYRARYRDSLGNIASAPGIFVHKKEAQNAAADAELKANAAGWRDPKSGARTWGDWATEWWDIRSVEPGTLKRDKSLLNKILLPKWGNTRLADITRHDVKAWAAALRRHGYAPASVKRFVYVFSGSLTAAVDAQIIPANPAARIKLPGGETDRRRYLTRDETGLMLAQFAPPVANTVNEAIVLTLLGTGMRWGEVAGLTVQRVDFRQRSIRVAEVWDGMSGELKAYPKSKRIRVVPIPDWVLGPLKAQVRGRRTGFMFAPDEGVPPNYSNWRSRVWVPAMERAGFPGVVIHDLRHTYASWLLQAGVPLAEVGRLLGHLSPATTQIYAHLSDVPSGLVLDSLNSSCSIFAPFSGGGES